MREPLVRHIVIMGLQVDDPVGYSLYCARMRPILLSYDGNVEYDFVVSEVIDSPIEASINRVQALSFPDPSAREAFFADEAHRRLLRELYDPAVASTALIGAYDAPGDPLA